MNRISNTFNKGKVFAAYITAGDGRLSDQLTQIRALITGGVNLIEIGVPFSDPIADGVVIQRAMQRALNAKTTVSDALTLIRAIRNESEIPIILFTYYNPILAAKQHHILKQTKEAGADGILIVDLPFFEGQSHLETCKQLDLAPIAVIAPTTSEERLKELTQQGQGFLYYACQKGTTGIRSELPENVKAKIEEIKRHTFLPIIIGFGIASCNASKAAITIADGFVVGSYFIKAIEEGLSQEELTILAREINPIK